MDFGYKGPPKQTIRYTKRKVEIERERGNKGKVMKKKKFEERRQQNHSAQGYKPFLNYLNII